MDNRILAVEDTGFRYRGSRIFLEADGDVHRFAKMLEDQDYPFVARGNSVGECCMASERRT